MIISEIKNLFNSLNDDQTELADTELINIVNKNLRKIASEREWGFLRKDYTGTLDANSEITVPTDFVKFVPNYAQDTTTLRPDTQVVYVGSDKRPYNVIPKELAEQNNYQLSYVASGEFSVMPLYAYYDYQSNKIYVKNVPNETVKFSYKSRIPEVALLTDSIPLPYEHQDVLTYSLLVDDIMIQKIDALKNMFPTYLQMYNDYMSNLRAWDARTFYNI